MRLSDLGERRVIERISGFLDIGDDAAYLKAGGRFLVMSTDVVYETTHFLPGMTFGQKGKFVVSVNLSDVAAMGAAPFAFLLAYVGPDLPVADFEAIIRGAERACRRHKVKYAGGDTKYAEKLALAGTACGWVGKPVLRVGARVGDVVAVAGTLGGASYAADCLLSGKKCPKALVKKAMEPTPRVREGILLGKYASAMTDVSDSLSVSLHHLASGVGIRLDLGSLPVDRGVPLDYALYGGGDYGLLFTMREDCFRRVKKKTGATCIGSVAPGAGVVASDGKTAFSLPLRGFEHFSGH
jgi:thiamine-monophosphate kinase